MAIGKITYKIIISKWYWLMIPVWFIQDALGFKSYCPKWLYKLEREK